ncbi:MAG: hypothetical protein EON60_12695 [Alphaproteobacteria bacterium]|nr:MAG: hypothetical protein EON60_12695 [Alphaproteobacteria bacterium]
MALSSTFERYYTLLGAHAAVTGTTAEEAALGLLHRLRVRTGNDICVEYFPSLLREDEPKLLCLRDFVQHAPSARASVNVPVLEDYTPDEGEREDMAVMAVAANEEAGDHEYQLTPVDVLVAAIALLGYVLTHHGVIRLRE